MPTHDPIDERVHERQFPTSALNDALRHELESLQNQRRLQSVHFSASAVTTVRTWIDGENLETYFAARTAAERLRYSGMVFRSVANELGKAETWHGAIHPRNLILADGDRGLVLVDFLANATVLGPWAGGRGDPWMWGPRVPENLTPRDWDRLSLLRTATLLSLGPEAWSAEHSTASGLDLCRHWAEQAAAGLESGDELARRLAAATTLLRRVDELKFHPVARRTPSLHLEVELDKLKARQSALRLLSPEDEEHLLGLLHGRMLSEDFASHLAAWLVQNDFQREAELAALSLEILQHGRFGETPLVTSGACIAAEAAWTYYGMAPDAARARIAKLMKEKGLVDERQELLACREIVAQQGSADTQRPAAVVEALMSRGHDERVANHLVELESEWLRLTARTDRR